MTDKSFGEEYFALRGNRVSKDHLKTKRERYAFNSASRHEHRPSLRHSDDH